MTTAKYFGFEGNFEAYNDVMIWLHKNKQDLEPKLNQVSNVVDYAKIFLKLWFSISERDSIFYIRTYHDTKIITFCSSPLMSVDDGVIYGWLDEKDIFHKEWPESKRYVLSRFINDHYYRRKCTIYRSEIKSDDPAALDFLDFDKIYEKLDTDEYAEIFKRRILEHTGSLKEQFYRRFDLEEYRELSEYSYKQIFHITRSQFDIEWDYYLISQDNPYSLDLLVFMQKQLKYPITKAIKYIHPSLDEDFDEIRTSFYNHDKARSFVKFLKPLAIITKAFVKYERYDDINYVMSSIITHLLAYVQDDYAFDHIESRYDNETYGNLESFDVPPELDEEQVDQLGFILKLWSYADSETKSILLEMLDINYSIMRSDMRNWLKSVLTKCAPNLIDQIREKHDELKI